MSVYISPPPGHTTDHLLEPLCPLHGVGIQKQVDHISHIVWDCLFRRVGYLWANHCFLFHKVIRLPESWALLSFRFSNLVRREHGQSTSRKSLHRWSTSQQRH